MSVKLITFLGRSDSRGYKTTAYMINGKEDQPSSFVGFNLHKMIKPDTLIIFGTSGSMWDHIFDSKSHREEGSIESEFSFGDELVEQRVYLGEQVDKENVTQELLDELTPLLAKALNCQVVLQLVSDCITEEEQVELISTISNEVEPGDKVHIDITHGFRTIPMVGLMSALYLKEVKDVEVENIWYGSFNPATQGGIIHNLNGLLHISDWIKAISTYKKDGDYGVFSELMSGDAGSLLAEAAFFERVNNISNASQKISTWRTLNTKEESAPAQLFSEELDRRLDWNKKGSRPEHEAKLAREYLDRKDYLRAATLALESLITKEAATKGDYNTYPPREEARELLRETSEDYRELNGIRNSLTHGLRANEWVAKYLTSEKALENKLRELFKALKI